MRLKPATWIGLALEVALVVANVLFELEPKVFWPLALVIGVVAAIAHAAPGGHVFKIKAKGNVKIKSTIPEGSVFDIQGGNVEIEGDTVQARRTFDWPAFFLLLLVLILAAYLGWVVAQHLLGGNPPRTSAHSRS